MANMTAINYDRPKSLSVDGRAVFIADRVTATTLATSDTMSWRIPAGLEVNYLQLVADDIDTTTNSVFRLGFLKFKSSDTMTADDDYFAVAGQTLLQAGGSLVCGFRPIRFDIETILRLTLNTGGTFQAGGVTAIVGGNMTGADGSNTAGFLVVA